MSKSKTKKIVAAVTCLVMAGSLAMTACSGCSSNKITEDTPLRIASDAFDGVFNPFFSTTGPDSTIVGQTQLSMLTTDNQGNIKAGDDEACVAKAYSQVIHGSKEQNGNDYTQFYTDYYFAIKDNIVFSDGTPLTIHDVLFNIYMYLDKAYTGSATLYSVDIQGLKEYRAQSYDEGDQAGVDSLFNNYADTVVNAIYNWADDEDSTKEDLAESLEFDGMIGDDGNPKKIKSRTFQEYIDESRKYFKEEMESDWASAEGSYDSDTYKKYNFTKPWEVFLYMYGKVTVKTDLQPDGSKKYTVDYNGWDKKPASELTKDKIIQNLLDSFYLATPLSNLKNNMKQMFGDMWASSESMRTYIASDLMGKYFAGELKVPNISGITVEKMSTIPEKGGTGVQNLGKELDVLKIRINGADPKAIYNFSFTVSPMHYYSTLELTKKAMEEDVYSSTASNFGVKFSSVDFMNSVKQQQLPMGAGPYKANATEYNDFYDANVVKFVRNDKFLLGKPKTKYIQYKVVASNQKLDTVIGKTKEIEFADPNATRDNIEQVKGKKGIGYKNVENLGYGYIGINAKFVKSMEIREAIMTAFNREWAIGYYGDTAQRIYRPMSKVNWAYPEGATDYFWGNATFNEEKAKERITQLVKEAGYTNINTNNVLTNSSGDALKYTFTIAGDSEDHPAAQTFDHAAKLLTDCGFEIEVTKDSNALRALATGDLQIWAAAWSSTIDPDMFQVYHMDSKATSVNNWGYNAIFRDTSTYFREYDIIVRLSELIDQAREIVNSETDKEREERSKIYAQALDLVMELKVEYPLYQRPNLYVWNSDRIKESSMKLDDVTPFRSPISNIWEVELNIK